MVVDLNEQIRNDLVLTQEEMNVFNVVAFFYPLNDKDVIDRLSYFKKLYKAHGLSIFHDMRERAEAIRELEEALAIVETTYKLHIANDKGQFAFDVEYNNEKERLAGEQLTLRNKIKALGTLATIPKEL